MASINNMFLKARARFSSEDGWVVENYVVKEEFCLLHAAIIPVVNGRTI